MINLLNNINNMKNQIQTNKTEILIDFFNEITNN